MKFMGYTVEINRDVNDKIDWVDVLTEPPPPFYWAAFHVENHVLVETVEFDDDRNPLWEHAGEVDPSLATDPQLCEMLAELFRKDGQIP